MFHSNLLMEASLTDAMLGGHYHKFYSCETTVSEAALNGIPRLQIIKELSLEPSISDLEKVITSLALESPKEKTEFH